MKLIQRRIIAQTLQSTSIVTLSHAGGRHRICHVLTCARRTTSKIAWKILSDGSRIAVLQLRSVIRVITLITLLCCFDEEGHSLCSKKDIPYVRRRTFFVFEARHFLCSKQDIPCVRSKTFLVFEAGHSLCCEEEISCVPITNKAHATFW